MYVCTYVCTYVPVFCNFTSSSVATPILKTTLDTSSDKDRHLNRVYPTNDPIASEATLEASRMHHNATANELSSNASHTSVNGVADTVTSKGSSDPHMTDDDIISKTTIKASTGKTCV